MWQRPGNLPQHSSTVTVSFPLKFSTEIVFNLQSKLLIQSGYVANRVQVVGVVSYGDKHALARLQYENCSPPKASVDTTGTQTLTICTKTVGVPASPSN